MKSQPKTSLQRSQLNSSITSSKLGTSKLSTSKVSTTKKKVNSPVATKILKKPSLNTSISMKSSLQSSAKVSSTPKKKVVSKNSSKPLQRTSTQLIHSKVDEILDDETSEVGRSIRSSRNNSMIAVEDEPSILQSNLVSSQRPTKQETQQLTESYRSQSRDLRSQIDEIRRQNQELESKLGRKIILKESQQSNPFQTTNVIQQRQQLQQSMQQPIQQTQQPFLHSQTISFPVQNRTESPTVSLPSRPDQVYRQEPADLRSSQLQATLPVRSISGIQSLRSQSAQQIVANIIHNSDDYKIASGAIKKADLSQSLRNSQNNVQSTPQLIAAQPKIQEQIQDSDRYDDVMTQQAVRSKTRVQNELNQSLAQKLAHDRQNIKAMTSSLTDSQLTTDEVPVQQTFQQRVCFNNKVQQHQIGGDEELRGVAQQQQMLQQQLSQNQQAQVAQIPVIQAQQTIQHTPVSQGRGAGANIFLQRGAAEIPQQVVPQLQTPVLSQHYSGNQQTQPALNFSQSGFPTTQQVNQQQSIQQPAEQAQYQNMPQQFTSHPAYNNFNPYQPINNPFQQQHSIPNIPQMNGYIPMNTQLTDPIINTPVPQNKLQHSGVNLNSSQIPYSRPIRTSLTPEEFQIQQLKVYNGIPITNNNTALNPVDTFTYAPYPTQQFQQQSQQQQVASLINKQSGIFINEPQNDFNSVQNQFGNSQLNQQPKMAPTLDQSPPGQSFRTLLIPNQLAICDFNKFDGLHNQKQAQIIQNLQSKEAFQVNKHVIDLVFGRNPVNASVFKSTKLGNKILELIQNYDVYNLKIMFIEMLMSQKVQGDCECIFDAYIQLTSRQ